MLYSAGNGHTCHQADHGPSHDPRVCRLGHHAVRSADQAASAASPGMMLSCRADLLWAAQSPKSVLHLRWGQAVQFESAWPVQNFMNLETGYDCAAGRPGQMLMAGCQRSICNKAFQSIGTAGMTVLSSGFSLPMQLARMEAKQMPFLQLWTSRLHVSHIIDTLTCQIPWSGVTICVIIMFCAQVLFYFWQ